MRNPGDSAPSYVLPDTSLPLAPTIRQIDVLQLLRAVAVILVIWCHSGQVLDIAGSRAISGFNVFGIDIFFVISGFILSLVVLRQRGQPGVRSMWEFMKRRFIRIYPIYWFIALLTLARLALSHQLFVYNYFPAFFLLPSFHYPGEHFIVSYSWTMNFEVFFYFFLALILLKTIKWAVPILIGLLSAFVLVGFIVGIRHPVVILVANPILLEFVFGAVIALLYSRLGRRRVPGIFLTTAGILVAFYLRALPLSSVATGEQMILVDQDVFTRVATWGICAALIVGGSVFWSPSLKSTLGKWWVLIGNSSYSTYVVSALALEYATRLFFKLDHPAMSISNRIFYQSTMVVTILAIGFGCYAIVEKPMLQKLQSMLLRKPAVRPAAFSPAMPNSPGQEPVPSISQT